jgi:hypothetical protein
MKTFDGFDECVWSRFFDFVFPDEETMTRAEVQAELRRLGVDLRPSLGKLRQALGHVHDSRDARAALESARKKRLSLLVKLTGIEAPPSATIRETLKRMIHKRLGGPMQAVYARKLEKAASDEDLRSLLEDISRLQTFAEDHDNDES